MAAIMATAPAGAPSAIALAISPVICLIHLPCLDGHGGVDLRIFLGIGEVRTGLENDLYPLVTAIPQVALVHGLTGGRGSDRQHRHGGEQSSQGCSAAHHSSYHDF